MAVSNPIAIASAALAAALAALAARTIHQPPPPPCVTAVEVFYSNERTGASLDTVLWVPPKGAQRDSLLKADSLTNGAILPDLADSFVSPRVQVCVVDTATKFRPVLKT